MFKPALIPTLFTVPALIVLVFLGTWQVERLQWKRNLVQLVEEKARAEPQYLPQILDSSDTMKYRRVLVSGRFLHDKEIHLFTGPKVVRGEAGYNIFTPLERSDGGFVLVDRGWVPASKKNQEARQETLVAGGEVLVEGMLHVGEEKGWFTPENNIDDNLWFWLDMPTINHHTGLMLNDYYVRRLKAEDESSLPIGGEITVNHRNDHLQYAITWYSLAIILLVIYVLYHTMGARNLKKSKK